MKHFYTLIILLIFSINTFAISIGFEKNIGQIVNQNNKQNTSVLYSLNLDGFNVNLNKTGFNYDFYESDENKIKTHRIEFKFKNFNPNYKIIQAKKIDYFENHIINNKEYIIHFYQKIIYKNFYQNIDLEFYVNNNSNKSFEYNFVLHPGADINDIQFDIKGAKEKLISNQLKIKLRFGNLIESLPKSWIEKNNKTENIKIEYCYHQNGNIGLQSNQNIENKKVVIDPLPIRKWGTHLNNNTGDFMHIYDVKFYKNEIILIGATNQQNLATIGPYQQDSFTSSKIFISKFDSLSNKVWLTYYGSDNSELARKLDIDNNGNVYFSFTTSDNKLATSDTFQPNLGGMNDMIIVKLNNNGSRIWATYFGGTDNEEAYDIAIDKENNELYVGGFTYSNNLLNISKNYFPVKTMRERRGLLGKFNLNGQLLWSTYTHGDIQNLVVDNQSNIIISEINISNHVNSIQFNSSSGSNVLTKLKPTSEILWTRKYLGNKSEINTINSEVNDIAIDNNNNIIIGGATNQEQGISFANAYTPNFSFNNYIDGNWAGFIQKYDSNGNIIFGTYVGMKGKSFVNSISVNETNDILVGGNSSETNQIIDNNGIMFSKNHFMTNYKELPELNSNGLAILMKFKPNGLPIWGFMYGDYNYRSRFYGIDYDPINKYIIAVGENKSPIMIGTPNASKPEPSYVNNQANDSSSIILFEDVPNEYEIQSNNECDLKNLIYTAIGAEKYQWTDIKGNIFSEVAEFNPPYYGEFICRLEKENKIGYITIMVYDKNPPQINPITKFICNIEGKNSVEFNLSDLKKDLTFDPTLSVRYYSDSEFKNELVGIIDIKDGQKIYAKIFTQHGCFTNSSVTFKLGSINTILTELETCTEENNISNYDLKSKSLSIANTYMIDGTKIKYYENIVDAKLNNSNFINNDIYINSNRIDKIYAIYHSGDVCMTIFEINLIEKKIPKIQIDDIVYTCENYVKELVLNNDYDRIVWSNGDIGNKTYYDKPGKYNVTVYKNNCTITKHFEIRHLNKLIFNYIYNGEYITFDYNYLNVEISLDGINWSNVRTIKLNSGYYNFFFRYSKDSTSCVESRQIYLYKDLPSVITPNGDGVNDYWNLSYLKELKYVRVFNRLGRIVFEANSAQQPIKWDGKYQLKQLQSDTYWYIIELSNGEKINGSLLIKNK